MPSKAVTAAQHRAVGRFVDDLQEALWCVTPERLSFARFHQSSKPHSIWLSDAAPVPLPGVLKLTLAVALNYQVVLDTDMEGGWRVSIVKYIYEIADTQGQSLFEFHWHPDGSSRVDTPHLHIRPGLEVGHAAVHLFHAITKAHIPTGWVSLPEVLHFLLMDLAVEPRRSDWENVLQATKERYPEHRS